jgi:rubrerythrin
MPLTKPLSTPMDILDMALAKERQAFEFYANMAARCKIDDVRRLFESLKDEEQRHMRLIEKMQVKLRLS